MVTPVSEPAEGVGVSLKRLSRIYYDSLFYPGKVDAITLGQEAWELDDNTLSEVELLGDYMANSVREMKARRAKLFSLETAEREAYAVEKVLELRANHKNKRSIEASLRARKVKLESIEPVIQRITGCGSIALVEEWAQRHGYCTRTEVMEKIVEHCHTMALALEAIFHRLADKQTHESFDDVLDDYQLGRDDLKPVMLEVTDTLNLVLIGKWAKQRGYGTEPVTVEGTAEQGEEAPEVLPYDPPNGAGGSSNGNGHAEFTPQELDLLTALADFRASSQTMRNCAQGMGLVWAEVFTALLAKTRTRNFGELKAFALDRAEAARMDDPATQEHTAAPVGLRETPLL